MHKNDMYNIPFFFQKRQRKSLETVLYRSTIGLRHPHRADRSCKPRNVTGIIDGNNLQHKGLNKAMIVQDYRVCTA